MTILERTDKPLLIAGKPSESYCMGSVTMIKTVDTRHLWYSSYDSHYDCDCDDHLCCARSQDEVHWEKPNLERVPFEGNNNTNILIDGRKIRANTPTVFLDEDAPAAERYKALLQKFLAFDANKEAIWHGHGAASPDGLHWKVAEKSHYPWNSDTQNECIWDKDRYGMYSRLWRAVDQAGKPLVTTKSKAKSRRTIGYTESPTFDSFPKAQEILAPDSEDPSDIGMYANGCAKLRDGLYVMFISCISTKKNVFPVQAAFSADEKVFHRLANKPIFDLGRDFDSRQIYVSPRAIPGDTPDSYWFYYFGTAMARDQNYPDKVHYGGGVGRLLVQITGSQAS